MPAGENNLDAGSVMTARAASKSRDRPMRIAIKQALLTGLILATSAIGLADKSAARHAIHRHASTTRSPVHSSSFEPARMIELRPGLFISSYSCGTDEGQGRWKPCESN
jgi:hypothetical protein